MAAAVPAIVAFAGTATLKAAALKIAGTVLLAFGARALSESRQRSALERARNAGERYNVRNTIEPLPILYGQCSRIGGAIVFQASHCDQGAPASVEGNTEMLTTVIAWGEGECWAHNSLYINDRLVDVNGGDIVTDFAGYVTTYHYLGPDAQTADAYLIGVCADVRNPALAGKWTSNHRLRGVCYSIVTLKYSPGKYGFDGIPTFVADVQGRVVNDPRIGSSYNIYSRNPALIALDYLRNTRFGCGVPDDEIDIDSFKLAASYCDERDDTLEYRARRWQCDIVLDPTNDMMDNLAQILSSCAGHLVRAGGVYRLWLEKADPVVYDLNEDNLTGEWSIQMDGLDSRYNRVRAQYINAAKNYQPDFVVVEDADYRLADGNEMLETEIQLPGVTTYGRAYDLAQLVLRQSRLSIVVEVNALIEGMRCEVGDVVTVTHEVPGWTAKKFRVWRIALRNNDEVRLTLREYDDSVYSDQTDNIEVPPGTTLANPLEMPPVAVILTTPASTECVLRWDYPESYNARWFEVQWIAGSTSFPGGSVWVDPATRVYEASISATETSYDPTTFQRRWTLTGLTPSTAYAVRIRARSAIGGASTSWGLNWLFTTTA